MKRLLTIALIIIGSIIFTAWGKAQENPAILYTGLAIGILLTLVLTVYLIKTLLKLTKYSFASLLFVLLSGIILYALSRQNVITPVISYFTGIALGVLLLLVIMRWIARKSHTSLLFGEVFAFATGYQVKAFVRHDRIAGKDECESENNDIKNIILVLHQQFGYSRKEAEAAAEYAVNETEMSAPLEDKIYKAAQYHGRN